MGCNKKKIYIFVYIILKKKLNKNKDIERLSVEVAGFIMIWPWFVIK